MQPKQPIQSHRFKRTKHVSTAAPLGALRRLLGLLIPLLCFATLAPGETSRQEGQPVRLIVDTDFESDVDDVAALALLHALADKGKVEILGIGVAGINTESAPAIDAVNSYFGRPDLPIGIRRESGVQKGSSYTRMLIEEFPSEFDPATAPSAVSLYRQILAEASDGSVVIVSLGYPTNLAELLDAPPDRHSPLLGKELIRAKVSRYICMGGRYPEQQDGGNWGNFLPDPKSAIAVNENWPGPLLFTGGGEFSESVPVGRAFVETFPESNLLHKAYDIFFANAHWASPPDHHSADLIPIFIAACGIEPFFVETTQGSNVIAKDGTMRWQYERDDPYRSYVADLAPGVDGTEVGRHFEELIWESCQARTGDASGSASLPPRRLLAAEGDDCHK